MHRDDLRTAVLDCLISVAPEVCVRLLDAHRSFHEQLDFDSVDFLNFIMTLEKRLSLRIAESDYPRLSSLSGCLVYLGGADPEV